MIQPQDSEYLTFQLSHWSVSQTGTPWFTGNIMALRVKHQLYFVEHSDTKACNSIIITHILRMKVLTLVFFLFFLVLLQGLV